MTDGELRVMVKGTADEVLTTAELRRIYQHPNRPTLILPKGMTDIAALPKTVLHFSGHKDSLACLYLLEPYWDEITVAWMNTGAAYPESLEQMKSLRKSVPFFLEVRADVRGDIERNGLPTDILPLGATVHHEQSTNAPAPVRMRSWFDCCWQNMWVPMYHTMIAMGARVIIRGQRNNDQQGRQVPETDTINGIRYWYPIATWTSADVFSYLRSKGVEIARCYDYMSSGLDCICCTALALEKGERLAYLRDFHPEAYSDVRDKMQAIHAEAERQISLVREVLKRHTPDPPSEAHCAIECDAAH